MTDIRTWAKAFGLAALLALTACGGGGSSNDTEDGLADGEVVQRSRAEQKEAERRDQQRQRAVEDAEADFTYFRYAIDVSGDRPEACFVFSSPLDPETDYASFIEFRPALRPVLSIDGRELCVTGLDFGEERIAVLRSGLPAADGRVLEREEEVPVSFEDRPAYVGFKGSGVILPRIAADGLPVETVNVDSVEISVSRVNDRALAFKSIGQGTTTGQGRYSYLYGEESPDNVSTELWSGTMDVDRVQNAPVTTVFPIADVIGELEPGAYVVRLEDARDLPSGSGPPAAARRWIVMTDLALTAYEGGHGLDVTLRSLQSGQPVAAASVQLIARNNDILAETLTSAEGRVSFGAPLLAGTGSAQARLVMAYGEAGDIAVLDLDRAPVDLASDNVGGRTTRGPVDGFVYSDRGIYRPGEDIHLTALMRNRAGVALEDRAGALVIRRPNGLEATRIRFSDAEAGGLSETYSIPRGAARGSWQAILEVDGVGEVGRAGFKVEDFVPQRIAVDLDTDTETPVLAGEIRNITANTRFLYGAPGAGLKVETRARIQVDPSPFAKFDGFVFGAYDETFREEIIEFPDQVSDGAGTAELRLNPSGRGADSSRPLRLNAVVTALEPGGRPVAESIRIPYRPRDRYIGIKSESGRIAEGSEASFEVAAVSSGGEAIAADIEWKLLAIDYHYDWYRENGDWRWRRSRTVATVNEGVLQTEDGATATINAGTVDWGNHQLIVTSGDATAYTEFWAGWGGSVSSDGVEAPDRVAVRAPEDPAKVGEDIQIAIDAPYDGLAQIVVATDRVLSVQNREVSTEGTRVSLPVTEDWGEGAYVMVTVYTPRNPVLQAKPRRAVGVAHVPVDMSRLTFDLAINAPEVIRPRTEQRIRIELDGGPREPVFLTLAAVDEGILRLTKFKPPDAVSHFFGKKALGVSLYDDYGRLLDPNLGLPAEVRTGGDQLGGEGLSVVPTKSVALFSGLVDVGRSGRADIELDIPDFNGELRLMAVAWSKTGVGSASRAITVRDEVPAELIMPRFLAPGDEAFITATIDNVEGEAGIYTASLSTDGPVSIIEALPELTLEQGERADERVAIETAAMGISDINLEIEGPGRFKVARSYPIETRSAFLPVARVSRELMQPGDEWSPATSAFDGLIDGSTSMTVSFSSLPLDASALYASLARYPYGCTEQTVSRAMPLLYSEQLVAMGTGERTDDGARTRVQQAVSRILNRQSADGSFGLWREGDRYASPWLGAYTTDFLHRAKQVGYAVPDEALERAYQSMLNVSEGDAWRIYGYDTDRWESRWHNDTQVRLMQRASAYAMYVLAKAGKADISRLRYLNDRGLDAIDSPLARAHIGAALALMGDRARAVNAFAKAEEAIGYENTGDYYQTKRRDIAGMLALAAEAGLTDVMTGLSERLAEDAPDPELLTTQEKAFMLLAVNELVGDEGGVKVNVDGLGRGNNNDQRYFLSDTQVAEGVSFTLRGDKPIYRTVIARGTPAEAPPPVSNSLSVRKRFFTPRGAPLSLTNLDQGDQIVTVMTITPSERRTNPLIVADLLPAGFEIETVLRPADGDVENGDDGAFAWIGKIDRPQTAEARDDRYVAAIDVRDQRVTLAYLSRAVTPGEFIIPGVTVEDMYRPDVNARSSAGRVSITPAALGAGGRP
ncbi:MAG: alpha-2-macroglobulin [Pseudomonadota bacterium]